MILLIQTHLNLTKSFSETGVTIMIPQNDANIKANSVDHDQIGPREAGYLGLHFFSNLSFKTISVILE